MVSQNPSGGAHLALCAVNIMCGYFGGGFHTSKRFILADSNSPANHCFFFTSYFRPLSVDKHPSRFASNFPPSFRSESFPPGARGAHRDLARDCFSPPFFPSPPTTRRNRGDQGHFSPAHLLESRINPKFNTPFIYSKFKNPKRCGDRSSVPWPPGSQEPVPGCGGPEPTGRRHPRAPLLPLGGGGRRAPDRATPGAEEKVGTPRRKRCGRIRPPRGGDVPILPSLEAEGTPGGGGSAHLPAESLSPSLSGSPPPIDLHCRERGGGVIHQPLSSQ